MSWSGTEQDMQGFVDKHAITFPSLNDQTGDLFARFGVPAQPAWVFVSADGTATTHLGALEPDLLDKAFSELTA